MSAIKVFTGEDYTVPEGASHEYECTFTDNGSAVQLSAISDARMWLDGLDGAGVATTINNRSNVDVASSLSDAGGGVAKLLLKLVAADAAILAANAARVVQVNRLTVKLTFTKVGGGTGTFTREVLYPVRNLHRIS